MNISSIAGGVAALVSQNYNSYANSVTNVVETTQNVDLSNMDNIATAQREQIQSEVKLQGSIAAQNADNESKKHVLDLFA